MSGNSANEKNPCFQYVLCSTVLEAIDSNPVFRRCKNGTQGHIRALGQYSNNLKLHRRFTKAQLHRALTGVVVRSKRFVVIARLQSGGLLFPDGPTHWRLLSTNAKVYSVEEIAEKAAKRRAEQAKATAKRRAAQRLAAGAHPGLTDDQRRRMREGYMTPVGIDAIDDELTGVTPPKLSDEHRDSIAEYTKKRRSGVTRTAILYCQQRVPSRGDTPHLAKAPRDLHLLGDSPKNPLPAHAESVPSGDKIARIPKMKIPRYSHISAKTTANSEPTLEPVAHILKRCDSEPSVVLPFPLRRMSKPNAFDTCAHQDPCADHHAKPARTGGDLRAKRADSTQPRYTGRPAQISLVGGRTHSAGKAPEATQSPPPKQSRPLGEALGPDKSGVENLRSYFDSVAAKMAARWQAENPVQSLAGGGR